MKIGKKRKRVMSKQESLKGRDNSNYMDTEIFVERFSRALKEYLIKTIGKESNHIGDLTAHASAFSEVFYSITCEF